VAKGTEQIALFEDVFSKPVVVQQDGEQRTSDGGGLLLGAVDWSLGLTEILAKQLDERRASDRIEHDVTELLRQRVFSIALGYADQNDSTRIGRDPVLKMLCGRKPSDPRSLASQPTLSRFETARSGRELVGLGRALSATVIRRLKKRHRHARRITIDLDSTEDPTHGQQPFTFFNGYYESWCYLPMLGFLSFDDQPVQHLYHARLRPGTAKDVRGTLPLLRRTVRALRRAFKKAEILVRLDAGFASPQLFDLLEELDVRYIIAIPGNSVLRRHAERHIHAARSLTEDFGETTTLFGGCSYRAQTWREERRVVFKAETLAYPGRELKDNVRFVVTDLELADEEVWKLYCGRGDVENRIKELHEGLEIDRTSCSSFLANQFRVLETAAAYVLYQELRHRLRKSPLARAQVWVLRERLFKIGALVKESVRRIVVSLPASYPWKELWQQAAHSAGALVT
jgi:hypothetical protein